MHNLSTIATITAKFYSLILVSNVLLMSDNLRSSMNATLSSNYSNASYYIIRVDATSKYNDVDVNNISYKCFIQSFLF